MSDEAALRRAAEARPDDDTPALVYADWLDDHDEPGKAAELRAFVERVPRPRATPAMWAVLRAPHDDGPRLAYAEMVGGDYGEFIRVQCELANHPVGCGVCAGTGGVSAGHDLRARVACWRPADLRRREQELWAEAYLNSRLHDRFPVFGRGQLVERDACRIVSDAATAASADVSRGFVAELHVPTLAVLLGGPCGRCEEFNEERRYDPTIGNPGHRCHECGRPTGTGTAPGIAAAVFGSHPVLRVVVADREPRHDGEEGWHWRQGTVSDTAPDGIPEPIMRGLWDDHRPEGRHPIRYPTRKAALDALSAACCSYGRSLAGSVSV